MRLPFEMHLAMRYLRFHRGSAFLSVITLISVAGVIMTNVELPWMLFLMKNLSLRGGLVNPQQYVEKLLALIQSGRLDPAELVTHRMPLSEGPAAYELFASHADGVMKVVLEP